MYSSRPPPTGQPVQPPQGQQPPHQQPPPRPPPIQGGTVYNQQQRPPGNPYSPTSTRPPLQPMQRPNVIQGSPDPNNIPPPQQRPPYPMGQQRPPFRPMNAMEFRPPPSSAGMRPPPLNQPPSTISPSIHQPLTPTSHQVDSAITNQLSNININQQQYGEVPNAALSTGSAPPPKSKRAQRVFNYDGMDSGGNPPSSIPLSQVPPPIPHQHQHQQPLSDSSYIPSQQRPPPNPQQRPPPPGPSPYGVPQPGGPPPPGPSPYGVPQPGGPPPPGPSPYGVPQPGGPPTPGSSPYVVPQPGGPPQTISNLPYAGQQASQNRGFQARNRIDPEAVPSPIAVQEADMRMYSLAHGGEPFGTMAKKGIPLASTDFVAIDQGISNPRFIRLTTYTLPTSEDLLNHSHIPLGLVIQPFAKLKDEEAPIPVVDFGENGPVRCRRCKSYINPFVYFIEGGSKFVCNMCGFANEVSQSYFCNLDMSGRRMDLDQRPELQYGTIEFKTPREYWVKETAPQPLSFVFAIDVSRTSIESGMLNIAVAALKDTLYGDTNAGGLRNSLHPGARIGIITYDRSVHFYDLSPGLEQAKMLVVPDVNDMFVPLSTGFLVDHNESRSVIEGLLDSLPSMFAGNMSMEPVLGAVVKSIQMALGKSGGKAFIFQTALPSYGPGALKSREDTKLYNTEKEKTLFAAQDNFYKMSSQELVEAGIGVDLFLFPSSYIDVATVGLLAGITGGEIYYYQNFKAERDREKFAYELKHAVTRETGYNVLMRVRCSNGLRVHDHFGNFYQRNITDLEFGTVDADKAVGVLVKYDGKLDEKQDAYFQCAMLYTTAEGERRVRTHNIAVPVTSSLGNVFRYADMDTTINFMSKEATSQLLNKPLREVRDQLTEKCVKILLSYRRNCASTTAKGQLILPEAYKLFPLYSLAMIKSKALRGLTMASDIRTYHMRLIKSIGVSSSVVLFYPRLMGIHDLEELDNGGRIKLPQFIRPSVSRLNPSGAYLLENGEYLFMWIGSSISPEFIRDIFGADSIQNINVNISILLERDNLRSKRLCELIAYIQSQRPKAVSRSLIIARQGIDGPAEMEFVNTLVEDANADAMSYVDYLCHVHKQIQDEVNRGHD